MKSFARLAVAALALVPVNYGASADGADQILDRIVENLRWSHYWSGKSGIDDVYIEGKKISALIFWNKSDSQPIRGLCSSEISLCVAFSGVYLDPAERRMSFGQDVSPRQALKSFIASGLRDSSHMITVEGLNADDFQVEQKSFILPAWAPPSSIVAPAAPEDASRAAERIKQYFRCWTVEAGSRRRECTGHLVFAFYGPIDPYWFVLRSCSTACETMGESVELVRRGDYDWEVTSAGLIDRPKAEVDRLKQQIEKAEMFRLQLRLPNPKP